MFRTVSDVCVAAFQTLRQSTLCCMCSYFHVLYCVLFYWYLNAVIRQISVLFIDNKDSVFWNNVRCGRTENSWHRAASVRDHLWSALTIPLFQNYRPTMLSVPYCCLHPSLHPSLSLFAARFKLCKLSFV